jgi:hypothetical protein
MGAPVSTPSSNGSQPTAAAERRGGLGETLAYVICRHRPLSPSQRKYAAAALVEYTPSGYTSVLRERQKRASSFRQRTLTLHALRRLSRHHFH